MQTNNSYQKALVDDQLNSVEGSMGICQNHESSAALARNVEDLNSIDKLTSEKSSYELPYRNDVTGNKKGLGVKEDMSNTWNCHDPLKLEVKEDVGQLKVEALGQNSNEPYFDSKSSWIEVDKHTPWWRTADTDELASLVAQRSLDIVENCDLPRPLNAHVKKDVDNMCCFSHHRISGTLLDEKLAAGGHHHRNTCTGSPSVKSACQKLEDQPASSTDNPSRDISTHEKMLEMHSFGNGPNKAQLMEALRHSQTRAREAERAAKQACAEKEHVVKLVFRQASQLFAYKQWLQVLQLETVYLQFINNTSHSVSMVFPPMLSQRTRKIRKNKQCSLQYEANKYAVVFALGLGLAGAGFFLGWTIGRMLPTW